jgi:hypothetical protein
MHSKFFEQLRKVKIISKTAMLYKKNFKNARGVNDTACTIDERFERPWQHLKGKSIKNIFPNCPTTSLKKNISPWDVRIKYFQVNLLTVVLNDAPVLPDDEDESFYTIKDSPQCVAFGMFMIW